jgi:hypothetical protein
VVLCVVDPPLDVLRQCLSGRNAEPPPGTFRIGGARLDAVFRFFQRPTPDELALFDPLPAGPEQQRRS